MVTIDDGMDLRQPEVKVVSPPKAKVRGSLHTWEFDTDIVDRLSCMMCILLHVYRYDCDKIMIGYDWICQHICARIGVGNHRNGYKLMYMSTCVRICSLDALRLLLFHSNIVCNWFDL